MSIPKFTASSVKFIRTLEGVLVVASNIVLILIPIVTTSLSAGTAVKYGVILNSVAVGARSLLKAAMAVGTAYPSIAVATDTAGALKPVVPAVSTTTVAPAQLALSDTDVERLAAALHGSAPPAST